MATWGMQRATSRFATDFNSRCGEIFNYRFLGLKPEESMQVDISFLKRDGVVHLPYVTKGNEDTSSEPQKDCSEWVQDVRTFDQHIFVTWASHCSRQA